MSDETFPLAGIASTPYAEDRLIAGTLRLLDKAITLLSGQDLVRGTLLGKRTVGDPTAAAGAGNTGTGTIGSLTIGTAKKPGVYKVVIIEPATDAGKFVVEDPDGILLGTGTVGVAFTATGAPSFTLSDGTDFVAGDYFNITVAEGDGKYLKSVAAATDGSQVPDAILAHDCDASLADKATVAYIAGDFNEEAVTYGAGHTAASVREGLRLKSIYLITPEG